MPGLDPGSREGGVIYELDVAEPAEHCLGSVVGYPAPPQRSGKLGAGPRRGRQHPQADLPGDRRLARVPGFGGGSRCSQPGTDAEPARLPLRPTARDGSLLRPTARGSSGSGGLAPGDPGHYRKVRLGAGIRIQPRAYPELLLDLLLDLVREIRVAAQEIPRVFLALAKLVALVGVPGAGLADDRLLHAKIDQAARPADADAIQ